MLKWQRRTCATCDREISKNFAKTRLPKPVVMLMGLHQLVGCSTGPINDPVNYLTLRKKLARTTSLLPGVSPAV